MKIIFIGQKGLPAIGGGVERYVEDIALRLAKLGHTVMAYTRPNYTSKKLTDYQGVKLISLPSIGTKHLDAISHTFLASIDAAFRKADVIHYQSIGPALVCWLPKLLNRQVRIVSTLQSRDYEHQKWNKLAKLVLKFGERLMCYFSDEIIVITESMKDYVRQEYNIEAKVISNGANLYPVVEDDSLIRQWGLTKDNYIVAISRLVRHKGLGHLILAYKKLTTDKKLVIVGEGSFTDDYISELKALVGDDTNIIFTGNQFGATLAQLYANTYLFVQPSESEGLSLALLEAMARRRGVLVSNIAENLEAIGGTGLVFENKSVNDLKEKLQLALDSPELIKDLGQEARRRIEQFYDWDDIVLDIIAIYNKAMKHKRTFTPYQARLING